MKVYSIIIFLFCFIHLYSQDSINPVTRKANVYFVRNRSNGLNNFDFYNNSKYIGKLGGSKYLKYQCEAGKQVFWAVADNKYFLEVNLEPDDTCIIEVHKETGFIKGRVRLELIKKGSDYFNYLENNLQKMRSVQFTEDEIRIQNTKRREFINRSLKNHENRKENKFSTNKNSDADSIHPIIIDYPLLDYPYINKSIQLSNITGIFTNPSMSQSLGIATSLNNLKREGIYRLKVKSPVIRKNYSLFLTLGDFITYLPIPLTSGWVHEEFHRAVLAKHGIGSYNDMNNFPVTKSIINVSHISDEDLIRLKSESPRDMVRLSEAGIEGQYLMSNYINKEAFFSNTKSISYTPLYSNLNSILYVILCSGKSYSDKVLDDQIKSEGSDITKRDAVGLDFISYTYDLFRPDVPYQNRGLSPSGVGINRYVKYSQLTSEEQSYLTGQGLLQLINLLNPISLMHNSFNLRKEKDGSITRANLYFNHWLTSFGYDISATFLLKYRTCNYAFTLHNYVNRNCRIPGIEAETYSLLIGKKAYKNPISVDARVMLWLQPEYLLFNDKNVQPGGLVEAKILVPVSKLIQPYLLLTAKTTGWVAGNVYQEADFSLKAGLQIRL